MAVRPAPVRWTGVAEAAAASAASNRRATSFAIAAGVAANPITSPFILAAPA